MEDHIIKRKTVEDLIEQFMEGCITTEEFIDNINVYVGTGSLRRMIFNSCLQANQRWDCQRDD